ncbi:transcription initiation factor TFIID subunit 12 [Nematocida sp. AWRm77]|nr:transcription initiation factor TFIID subunit 12 [Nematocida sp. AWRm77]
MGNEEQNLQKRIQHLQSMLGEINKYLQGAPAKPPGMISRLLDEKTRITAQLRDLNNVIIGRSAEAERPSKSFLGINHTLPRFEKEKENTSGENSETDPLEKRIDLEDLLQEMGMPTSEEMDPQTKKLILSGADIFLDSLIATACSVARNRNAEELSKEDIVFSMKMERNLEMYNTCMPGKQRDPDKEHLKRMHLIRKDQKRSNAK